MPVLPNRGGGEPIRHNVCMPSTYASAPPSLTTPLAGGRALPIDGMCGGPVRARVLAGFCAVVTVADLRGAPVPSSASGMGARDWEGDLNRTWALDDVSLVDLAEVASSVAWLVGTDSSIVTDASLIIDTAWMTR